MRTLALAAALALLAVIPESVRSQDSTRRAFEPGGPFNLVRTGKSYHSKLTDASRTATSMSFSFKTICHYELFIDEAAAKQAFERFRGQTVDALLKGERIQAAIINSDFPKLIVLSFSSDISGRDVRAYFSEELEKSISRRARELGAFLDTFRGDFKDGDAIEIRISGDTLVVKVREEQAKTIQSRDLARALLKMNANSDSLKEIGALLQP